MSLIRFAVEKQRWDLVAHTIVLAAAKALYKGEPDARRNRQKKYHKTQPKH